MSDAVRCKFVCQGVQKNEYGGERVVLIPVWNPDPATENYAYWKATPQGSLDLTITNPDAFGTFEGGREYYLDLRPVV